MQEIADELEAGPRNSSALLRRALADVRDGARSIAEAEAIGWLRQSEVPPFEVNAAVIGPSGSVVAVADILWRELRAIAEIDSREFHFSELAWKQTMARHNRLTALGFAVAHYTPPEIRGRQERWAADVARWLRARARELGLPFP